MLSADEFESVMRLKNAGNAHFVAGELTAALGRWSDAVQLYDGRAGESVQRAEKSKLHSNKAEAFLKLERYADARADADRALESDAANGKARFRRARALLALGGPAELALAMEDIKAIKAAGGTVGEAEAALLRTADGALLLKSARDKEEAAAKASAARRAEWRRRVGAPGGDAGAGAEPSADDLAKAARAVAAVAEYTDVDANTAKMEAHTAKEAAKAAAEEPAAKAPPPPERTEWLAALGNPGRDRHAWLIDCYRTRVDDDRAGGPSPRAPHGLGEQRPSRLSVLSDVLLFLKLAVARRVVPSGTDWEGLLSAAGEQLDKAFNADRCRATARYGEAGTSGAFRRCAALVYEGEGGDGLAATLAGQIGTACWGDDERDGAGLVQHRFSFDREPAIFDNVGGVEAWRELNQRLKAGRLK